MFQYMDLFIQTDPSIIEQQRKVLDPLMNLERRYMDSLEIGTGLNPEYNDEPVFYCKHCLSLKIRDAGLPDLLYCDECGSADILTTNIEEWENLYKERHGFKFLDRNYNIK